MEVFIGAFRLSAQALVAQRIAKKLLVGQGAPTAADKRLINDTLKEPWWHAALKPSTVCMLRFIRRLSVPKPTPAGRDH